MVDKMKESSSCLVRWNRRVSSREKFALQGHFSTARSRASSFELEFQSDNRKGGPEAV